MLQLTIIGHLGADAEVKDFNGRKFVSFRVAHSEKFNDAQGNSRERTQWVSCALNGDGGGLLPYLTRGTQVCVVGDMTLGVASSQIQRAMVATCNIHVRSIELIGGSGSDAVPRKVADETGLLYDTIKVYTVSAEDFQRLQVPATGKTLYDTKGGQYVISQEGVITKIGTPEVNADDAQNNG